MINTSVTLTSDTALAAESTINLIVSVDLTHRRPANREIKFKKQSSARLNRTMPSIVCASLCGVMLSALSKPALYPYNLIGNERRLPV